MCRYILINRSLLNVRNKDTIDRFIRTTLSLNDGSDMCGGHILSLSLSIRIRIGIIISLSVCISLSLRRRPRISIRLCVQTQYKPLCDCRASYTA